MCTLDQLEAGQRATVRHIRAHGPFRRRVMDMGLVIGVEIEMVKAAPLGDPVEYKLLGYHLSLRRADARAIEVEYDDSHLCRHEHQRRHRHGRARR
jgi:ferrous iron transport protein A